MKSVGEQSTDNAEVWLQTNQLPVLYNINPSFMEIP